MVAVSPLFRLLQAALGVFMFVTQVAAQETRVAAAANADVIALYSPYVEKRLLRAHFDRANAKLSLVPFGPLGVEKFAVAPDGALPGEALIVYSTTRDDSAGVSVTYLSLLDQAGNSLGEPLRSPVGAIVAMAMSPKGDRVAVSSEHGWLALLAVEGTGAARRLARRKEIGVSADRQFTFAFRPDSDLVAIADDWLATFISNDGTVQRTVDLKAMNRDLQPANYENGSLFWLTWSPRDDRFAVSWGAGPMFTTIFDSAGRRVKPAGADSDFNFAASKIEFVDGGDAAILYGMQAPVLVRLKSLASTAFGDPGMPVYGFFTPLAGGRDVAALVEDRIALWSLDGKPLTGPVGLENYILGAAAGAKDELLVAAERAGWVDLYTKDGEFLRRVQSGMPDRNGFVALSADGGTLAALGSAELGVIEGLRARAWGAALPRQSGSMVAVAGDGSRLAAEGPNQTVLSWPRAGAEADRITLRAGEQAPGRRLSSLAVSTKGDAIAVAEEGAAVWLIDPADKSVRRIALAAASVAPLPDGSGFAVGLADGTVGRISRDGTVRGPLFKAADLGGIGRIVVAPDGQSAVVVEDDDRQSRHFAWDGRLLAGPYRAGDSESISGAFFHEGAPKLIARFSGPTTDETFGVVDLAPPDARQLKPLDPPR
jgi:hypothetical protein